MSDDLNDLKAALKAATPAPDVDAKQRNLALAQKNFKAGQGSLREDRLTSERPKTGFWRKGRSMFQMFGTRAALVTSTALLAGAFVVLGPLREALVVPSLRGVVPESAVTASDMQGFPSIALDTDEGTSAPMTALDPASIRKQSEPTAEEFLEFVVNNSLSSRSDLKLTLKEPVIVQQDRDTEAFSNAASSSLKIVGDDPVSTFSIDVDTASYAVLRNSLLAGLLPPKDAVRVEEMINYFPYDYPAPGDDLPFRPTVSVMDTPWNAGTQLVHIAIQGAVVTERPPLNLVFLVDTSGSMHSANKLPLLKQSLALMLGQLQPQDQVAIVSYAGNAGQVLAPTAATDREAVLQALDRLEAGGATAGQAGLQQAYALAASMQQEGDVSRVILATDGDFNVGLSDPQDLKDFISQQRESGTYLSVLGFGRGNLDDAAMQALAQNGNGQAAYIDTLSEAQKVLVDQLSGALFPIADDVKIQVEFNPAQIAEYRLIGYETRSLRREDFNNDKVDAGDIGAGHQVTALYEVTPVGSPAQLNDPLRYGTAPGTGDTSDELGFLRLRYKTPGQVDSALIEQPLVRTGLHSQDALFSVAMAGFGQLLRDGAYLGDWGWEAAIGLAVSARGEDPFGYRSEAVRLMRLAESLSAR